MIDWNNFLITKDKDIKKRLNGTFLKYSIRKEELYRENIYRLLFIEYLSYVSNLTIKIIDLSIVRFAFNIKDFSDMAIFSFEIVDKYLYPSNIKNFEFKGDYVVINMKRNSGRLWPNVVNTFLLDSSLVSSIREINNYVDKIVEENFHYGK